MIRITQKQLDDAWEAAKRMSSDLDTIEIPIMPEFKLMEIDPKNSYPKDLQVIHLRFSRPGLAIMRMLKAGYGWELMSEYELIK